MDLGMEIFNCSNHYSFKLHICHFNPFEQMLGIVHLVMKKLLMVDAAQQSIEQSLAKVWYYSRSLPVPQTMLWLDPEFFPRRIVVQTLTQTLSPATPTQTRYHHVLILDKLLGSSS